MKSTDNSRPAADLADNRAEKTPEENDLLLKIDGLSVEFHTDAGIVKAVNNLNLQLGRKETLGFVGETGAGKTTTALSVMGLVDCPPGKYTSGKIVFEGEDLMKKSEREMEDIRGNKISMIFQDPMTSLNPIMTVGKQIEEVILLHQKVKDKAELKSKAIEMLKLVGIRPERYADYPHQFSGGMKQRVVIAMALSCNPKLLIADEPTTALDVTIQAQVLELMKGLKEKYDTSMILITHDLGIVAEICDYVAVIYAGGIVEFAPIEKLYNNPQHPYTLGLFNSIPALDDEADRLKVIAGTPPDPSALPKGCAFHPRCPHCMECCKTRMPKAMQTEDGHFTHCFLFDDSLSEEERRPVQRRIRRIDPEKMRRKPKQAEALAEASEPAKEAKVASGASASEGVASGGVASGALSGGTEIALDSEVAEGAKVEKRRIAQ